MASGVSTNSRRRGGGVCAGDEREGVQRGSKVVKACDDNLQRIEASRPVVGRQVKFFVLDYGGGNKCNVHCVECVGARGDQW